MNSAAYEKLSVGDKLLYDLFFDDLSHAIGAIKCNRYEFGKIGEIADRCKIELIHNIDCRFTSRHLYQLYNFVDWFLNLPEITDKIIKAETEYFNKKGNDDE